MPEPEQPSVDSVVRTRRLEIVDDSDRVRAVVGRLGTGGRDEAVIGIASLDARGSSRAWLSLDACGSSLVFGQEGNNVVYLGVDDGETEAANPGPYFELCGRDGATAIAWRVDRDGSVVHRLHELPWADDADG